MSDTPTPLPAPVLSRRSLLASASAFTIVAPQSIRGSQANSKLSVGLIGAGGRGSYDAGIVHGDPRASITALCDLYDDRIETAKATIKVSNPKTCTDFEKLLADPSIDAVFIATPPFEHPRMLEAAIASRKHVYCEKPIGVDYAGCQRAMAAGRQAGPKQCVAIGFQQRYGPVYLEAYKRIQEGQIGPLVNARASWIAGDPFHRVPYSDPGIEKLRNWFCYPELSGDIIVEQDCHNFDDLHWFLGATPLKAVGYGGAKVRTSMQIMDHLTLSFEWPGGIHVNYEANQLTPPGFTKVGEEFTGTKGVIETSRARMIHHKSKQEHETIPSPHDITIDAIGAFLGRVLSGGVENVVERSAHSTMIAILGRTAIYTGKEVTWKALYGA
ncbi:MAG: Gfo/Idh/MocA family protein [Bryobacteraceae bacterium]